jgi:hypothetical protein
MVVNSNDRMNSINGSSRYGGGGVFGRTTDGFRQFGTDIMEKDKNMYDPEREEKEMEFEKMVKSISRIDRKDETELRHGDEGGTIYKYDLPVVNSPIIFHNKLMVIDQEKEALTQVQELFDILDCDKDTAFESFIIKFN